MLLRLNQKRVNWVKNREVKTENATMRKHFYTKASENNCIFNSTPWRETHTKDVWICIQRMCELLNWEWREKNFLWEREINKMQLIQLHSCCHFFSLRRLIQFSVFLLLKMSSTMWDVLNGKFLHSFRNSFFKSWKG